MTLFVFWPEKKRQKSLIRRDFGFRTLLHRVMVRYNACHLSVWNVFRDVLIFRYQQKRTWHHLITYSDHKISNIYENSKTFSTTKVLPCPSSLRIYGFIMWNSQFFLQPFSFSCLIDAFSFNKNTYIGRGSDFMKE